MDNDRNKKERKMGIREKERVNGWVYAWIYICREKDRKGNGKEGE